MKASCRIPARSKFSPSYSAPVLDLSDDQTKLTLTFFGLQPATQYTLSLNSEIKHLSGNPLDQDPTADGNSQFALTFKTAPLISSALPGLQSGGGVVSKGIYAYALERGGHGVVDVYDLSNPLAPANVATFTVPGFPR